MNREQILKRLLDLTNQGNFIKKMQDNYTVANHEGYLNGIGSYVSCREVDKLCSITEKVLMETDPIFDFPPEERLAAKISQSNKTVYSPTLKEGITETLAIIQNHKEWFKNCDLNRTKSRIDACVGNVFKEKNYKVWLTLDVCIPNLAEASPDSFLSAVDQLFYNEAEILKNIVKNSDSNPWDSDALRSIRHALGILAWKEEFFMRAIRLLGKLANYDMASNGQNLAVDKITQIVLPWSLHTEASIAMRHAVVGEILEQNHDIGLQLLDNLLPYKTSTSVEGQKPRWIQVANEIPLAVSQDYAYYSQLYVSEAGKEMTTLKKALENIYYLDEPSFKLLMAKTAKYKYKTEEQLEIWNTLVLIQFKNARMNEKRGLSNNRRTLLEETIMKLAPCTASEEAIPYFTNEDWDIASQKDDIRESYKELNKKRQQIISEIILDEGADGLFKLAKKVRYPDKVGYSLAAVKKDLSFELDILPGFLVSKEPWQSGLANGYVWAKYYEKGIAWFEQLGISKWTSNERISLANSLPFNPEVWNAILTDKKLRNQYWKKCNVVPQYCQDIKRLEEAANELLSVGRKDQAVSCLATMIYNKVGPDIDLSVKVLRGADTTKKVGNSYRYHVLTIIKYLESHKEDVSDQLAIIELYYSPFFDQFSDPQPTALISYLEQHPEGFCDMIDMAFPEDEKKSGYTVENLQRFLLTFHLLPGRKDSNGGIDAALLNKWILFVENRYKNTKIERIVKNFIGGGLAYHFKDENGFWMQKPLAQWLNEDVHKVYREAFVRGVINSRGIFTVDSNATEEKALQNLWGERANQSEISGFVKLAEMCRRIVKIYKQEENDIVARHRKDNHLD